MFTFLKTILKALFPPKPEPEFPHVRRIIESKIYDTETAHLLAENRNFSYTAEGTLWERLYITSNAKYFTVSGWMGWFSARNASVIPVDLDKARAFFEGASKQFVDYESALGIEPEEA
jgi:hypothetical protein